MFYVSVPLGVCIYLVNAKVIINIRNDPFFIYMLT